MIKSNDHKILIITMILFFSVISAQDWNVPFIDTDETILLVEGMTKKQVLDKVGMPLLVHSGNDSTKSIKWIYEVRMIKVESEKKYRYIQPRKSYPNYVHSIPIHRLALEFRDNRLHNWKVNDEYNNFEKDLSYVTTEKKVVVVEVKNPKVGLTLIDYLQFAFLAFTIYLAIVV